MEIKIKTRDSDGAYYLPFSGRPTTQLPSFYVDVEPEGVIPARDIQRTFDRVVCRGCAAASICDLRKIVATDSHGRFCAEIVDRDFDRNNILAGQDTDGHFPASSLNCQKTGHVYKGRY